jgi:uncharacterized membrane protein YtjA (UPF0391 family)
MKKVKVIFVSFAIIAALFVSTGVAGATKPDEIQTAKIDPGVGGGGGK